MLSMVFDSSPRASFFLDHKAWKSNTRSHPPINYLSRRAKTRFFTSTISSPTQFSPRMGNQRVDFRAMLQSFLITRLSRHNENISRGVSRCLRRGRGGRGGGEATKENEVTDQGRTVTHVYPSQGRRVTNPLTCFN